MKILSNCVVWTLQFLSLISSFEGLLSRGGWYSSGDTFLVDLGLRFSFLTSNWSANQVFYSIDVIPATTEISKIKVFKPLFTWHHPVINLKLAPLLYFNRGLRQKMMTRKIWLRQFKWRWENRIGLYEKRLHAHERWRERSWYLQEPQGDG